MNRRWRVPRVARARRFEPPFVTVAATPPAWVPDSATRPKSRKPAWRRSRLFMPVQVATPVSVPPTLHVTRPKPVARRGKFTTVPAAVGAAPTSLRGTPRRTVTGRRGRFTTSFDQANAPAPTVRAAPRRPAMPRFGLFFAVPIAPAPPALPPSPLHQVSRLWVVVRRGHTTEPPPVPAAPTTPVFVPAAGRSVATRRLTVPRSSRARFQDTPTAQPVPAMWMGYHPAPQVVPRRGRFRTPPASSQVAAPSMVPQLLRRTAQPVIYRPRGVFRAVLATTNPEPSPPQRHVIVSVTPAESRWQVTPVQSRWTTRPAPSRWVIEEA